jgi:hypothetical protein
MLIASGMQSDATEYAFSTYGRAAPHSARALRRLPGRM